MRCGYPGANELETQCAQPVRAIEPGAGIRFTGRVVDIEAPKQPEMLCRPKVSDSIEDSPRHRHDRCGDPASRRLETL
ncbi:hypothetical protein EMIT0111MI5_370005 [Burkholderia sp. IT-111MI5]